MEEKKITISYNQYSDSGELPIEESELLSAASEALKSSYAPYSQFRVGAAVLLDSGKVVLGSNQENTAYPSGLCAERVAIFAAKAKYPDDKILAVAVTAQTDNFEVDKPITPCGACRQVIAETEKRQKSKLKILMRGHTGPIISVDGVEALLPLMFHEEKLKK